MNIFQRLNEVRKKVAYVQKDKKVDGAGYMAVTHDAVTALVREHLVEHGIMVVPCLVKSTTIQESGMTTGKGIPIIRYEATFNIDFVNCDEPSEKVTVVIEAHALDNGDKAPGKAASYATKYAMLKLFSIETGEDDEGRLETKPKKEEKASHSPTDGALAALAPAEQIKAKQVANTIVDLWADEKPLAAYEQIYSGGHEGEFILAVWEVLRPHSAIRSELKKMHKEAQK